MPMTGRSFEIASSTSFTDFLRPTSIGMIDPGNNTEFRSGRIEMISGTSTGPSGAAFLDAMPRSYTGQRRFARGAYARKSVVQGRSDTRSIAGGRSIPHRHDVEHDQPRRAWTRRPLAGVLVQRRGMRWPFVVRVWAFAGLLVAAGCGGSNGMRPDGGGAGGIGVGGSGGGTAIARKLTVSLAPQRNVDILFL